MTNQCQNLNKKVFDLEKRTAEFGKRIIIFLKGIVENTVTRPIVSQLVRAATSVGANYMEADCAESKKDFRHKISICKKEAKETTYWIHMLAIACPEESAECRVLWKEARELTLIFSSIVKRQGF